MCSSLRLASAFICAPRASVWTLPTTLSRLASNGNGLTMRPSADQTSISVIQWNSIRPFVLRLTTRRFFKPSNSPVTSRLRKSMLSTMAWKGSPSVGVWSAASNASNLDGFAVDDRVAVEIVDECVFDDSVPKAELRDVPGVEAASHFAGYKVVEHVTTELAAEVGVQVKENARKQRHDGHQRPA
jgi:hypothetical protein